MCDSHQKTQSAMPFHDRIEFCGGDIVIDVKLLGELLGLPASRVSALMREGSITSVCERGIDDHESEFRLTFFYLNRRARLSTDMTGRILRKSVIDFGGRPLPELLRRPDS
jgi:Family of unknown function (DUF6522)